MEGDSTMRFNRFFSAVALGLVLAGCAGHGTQGGSSDGMPPLSGPRVRMHPTDLLGGGPAMLLKILLGDSAPVLDGKTLAHLYVGVRQINVSSAGQTQTLASFASPHVIDVLAYQGNSADSVTNSNVSSRHYDSLTFVLDVPTSQAVFTDGSSLPLTYMTNTYTRSSAGAGSSTSTVADGINAVDVTNTQGFDVPSDQPQAVRVDFNAFESLWLRYGTLYANPVLYVSPIGNSGQIAGTVVNSAGSPVGNATVVATDPYGNVKNTAVTGSDGTFNISTLTSGSYQLTIYNTYVNAAGHRYIASGESSSAWSSSATVTGPNVNVTAGSTTNAGNLSD